MPSPETSLFAQRTGLALETFGGKGRLNPYGPSEGSATIYEVEAEPAKGGAYEPR